MERGGKRPDPRSTLLATVRAAAGAAARAARGLPMLAGGKSMGGRMTSLAAAEGDLPRVRGLVFLGFPLHRPGHPGRERAAHLPEVDVPMLFLQGTRDTLADIGLIRQVTRRLGKRAHLHVVEGGDHSFQVLKRSGRTGEDVLLELVDAISRWTRHLQG
jgi:predicted alpha/beta-hydrolase family hydrolase